MIKRYFNVAKELSLTSTFPRVKIGAILVLNKQVISVGVNTLKSHPKQKEFNQFRFPDCVELHHHTHAELNCLKRVKGLDLGKAKLFVYRQTKDNKTAMARPCPACLELIRLAGIKEVFYSTERGYCYEEIDC